MRMITKLALAAVLAVAIATPVLADVVSTTPATSTPVVATSGTTDAVVPYGAAIQWVLSNFEGLIEAIATVCLAYVVAKLPKPLGTLLGSILTEQLLKRSVDYGINATAGAVSNKELDIKTGSEVLANAVNFAVEKGAPWLVSWLGGVDGITKSIYARLNLEPAATPATVAPAAAVTQTVLPAKQ